eukprot:CAMPEP_0202905616 /NCGR_PEP_ID=MMETSP1392-20130828/35286_1 /ASSEMBLY_ACC=CAM_ASM_000868 /TAXON_ID=225041 /ORGANISM="Chlamydomonas chlamydogama, Strain SAG 11-48b" /LENGTH=66 /DNA_ID=CAMNT_0049593809 /DNA_START=100 /DNA_END=297 /DNA_ORIENTATION=+
MSSSVPAATASGSRVSSTPRAGHDVAEVDDEGEVDDVAEIDDVAEPDGTASASLEDALTVVETAAW